MEGRTDGWVDGWMDGSFDGSIDGMIDISIDRLTVKFWSLSLLYIKISKTETGF